MALTMDLEAKNVEQAVKLACDKLEIPPEKLKYDVISYGSTGIFGFVKTKKPARRARGSVTDAGDGHAARRAIHSTVSDRDPCSHGRKSRDCA